MIKGMPINITDHTVRLGYVEKYTIQPDLPSTLSLNPVTGDIVGTVEVCFCERFRCIDGNESSFHDHC